MTGLERERPIAVIFVILVLNESSGQQQPVLLDNGPWSIGQQWSITRLSTRVSGRIPGSVGNIAVRMASGLTGPFASQYQTPSVTKQWF